MGRELPTVSHEGPDGRGGDGPPTRDASRTLETGAESPRVTAATGDGNAGGPAADGLGDPEAIGRYRVVRQLGAGGFGVVYEAEQTEPVRRGVALKIIKPGMDSESVLRRFEAERQALAVMDHPGVAKVLDGGVTPPEQGSRPYFVMELVRGEPIGAYCDRRRLGVRDRVAMMIDVCEAVQHAHNKGVLHRDLKPANILAFDLEGKPAARVIDFGIAKALSDEPDLRGEVTVEGMVIGTPAYMSPEQASGSGLDIDTRADVYSLGVVLYELLTGELPFDMERLRSAGLDGALKIIREVEPQRPSNRLASRETAIKKRSAEGSAPATVNATVHHRALRRELDWIVMRCLAKDRDRRYATVAALAADLRRYLAGEAVEAGPESRVYLTRKFVQRNRLAVGVVAVAAALLVGLTAASVVVAGVQAALRAEADYQRRVSEATVEFLRNDILFAADPDRLGVDVTVAEALAAAAERVGERYDSEPLIEAAVRDSIGGTYEAMGLLSDSGPQLRRAYELRRDLLGPDHEETLESAARLIGHLWRADSYDEALEMADRLVASRESSGAGLEALAEAHELRASALKYVGRYEDSAAAYDLAVGLYEDALDGGFSEAALTAEYDRALLRIPMGQLEEGIVLMREAHARALAHLEPERTIAIWVRTELGGLLARAGENEEASEHLEAALELHRRVSGERHWRTLECAMNTALVRRRLGDLEGAHGLRAWAVEGYREKDGAADDTVVRYANGLARWQRRDGIGDACATAQRVLSDLESEPSVAAERIDAQRAFVLEMCAPPETD